jgi:outer membrane cobalamin receptor
MPKGILKIAVGAFLVGLILPNSRVYSTEAEDVVDDVVDEVVEVKASRTPQVSELPSAQVTVIKTEDLGPGVVTTSMMAKAAPAARVREFGGLGQQVTIGLRGAAANQTLVQIDGVTLPDPTGSGVDLSGLPASFVERMEVLRGASSVQAGTGALGGVINLVTRSEKSAGYFGRTTAGSFETFQASAGTAFGIGIHRFLLVASGLTTAGDFSFIDNRRLLRGFRVVSGWTLPISWSALNAG